MSYKYQIMSIAAMKHVNKSGYDSLENFGLTHSSVNLQLKYEISSYWVNVFIVDENKTGFAI